MNTLTVNKIAVTPFPDNSVKAETYGTGAVKVAKIANTKHTLVKLKVLATAMWVVNGNTVKCIYKDSEILVRSSEYSSPWGKEIFTEGLDQPFILFPFDRVEIFLDKELEAQTWPALTFTNGQEVSVYEVSKTDPVEQVTVG